MPRYTYLCKSCGEEYTMFHGIHEVVDVCIKCGAENNLFKVPSFYIAKEVEKDNRVGDLVKKKIEEYKEDLKKEKRDIKGKDY